ncbi:MAG: 3-deoxy-D-manno-octulosonic acid transferase [Alphaproteobacteria bacterium]
MSIILAPMLRMHLKRRIAKGKEERSRLQERFGYSDIIRPSGSLIWLHAVGLGEVMALRGFIMLLAKYSPEAYFLVTSSTKASAQVFKANLPPRTIHQYFPLDVPVYCKRFLEHWKPNLCIWSEQEIWPGMVWYNSEAGIPQVLINVRMNEKSYNSRARFKSMFQKIYDAFPIISAQDVKSANYIKKLGGHSKVDGSLKSIAPPLHCVESELRQRKIQIGDRPVLCLASSHEADEQIVLNALGSIPENMLVVLVPRIIERSPLLRKTIEDMGVSVSVGDQCIDSNIRVHLVNKFGELGIWYRICSIAFVGGSFDETQGHNPWEAIHLNRPVLHGPKIKNFKHDYAQLDASRLSHLILNSDDLADYLELNCAQTSAQQESETFNPLVADLENLATDLLALMDGDRVDK